MHRHPLIQARRPAWRQVPLVAYRHICQLCCNAHKFCCQDQTPTEAGVGERWLFLMSSIRAYLKLKKQKVEIETLHNTRQKHQKTTC